MHRKSLNMFILFSVVAVSASACDENARVSDLLKTREKKAAATTANAASGTKNSTALESSAKKPDVAPAAIQGSPTPPPVGAGSPEALGTFAFQRNTQEPSTGPTRCAFENFTLSPSMKIFAAGAYSGREIDFQIDQSGHQGTQIDVAVNHPDAPVVLMLGAYEPTIWNIGWSPKTRIAAVLVSGYHRQVIAGLPAAIPTLVSSYDNKGACGYFYVSPDKLTSLNPMAQKVFGHDVDLVYPAKDGRVVIGDAIPADISLITATNRSPESYRSPNAPLAGKAGLDEAIRNGLLRDATRSDALAWADAQSRLPKNTSLPPVAGGSPPSRAPEIFNAYVVLKPMTIPAGLYGANSATFFVPKGVPRPTGNPGHSAIFDFNTMRCVGAICGMH